MKILLRTTVLFAFLFLFCTPDRAEESVSVLLEKAIYQEETVGDLDEAILIYQKIAQEADANRSVIAQALYRLGLCYSKKGEHKKASALFEKLIQEYPEQKKPVESAKIQSSRIRKHPDFLPLNQVVQRTIYDDGESQAGKEIMIDFDTGKLLSLPEELRNQQDGMRRISN